MNVVVCCFSLLCHIIVIITSRNNEQCTGRTFFLLWNKIWEHELISFATWNPEICVDAMYPVEGDFQRKILCQTEFMWNVYPASGNLLCKEEIFFIGFSKFSDSELLVSEDVLYRTFLADKKNMKLSMTSFTLPNLFWQQRRIIWKFPKASLLNLSSID